MLQMLRHVCLQYRDKFLKKIRIPIIKPWMRYREIEIIEEILRNLKPRKCLEWGAGYSTIRFPKILNNNAEWICIEHEHEWFLKIQDKKNSNTALFYIPANKFPWTDEFEDGCYSDLKDYIEFPRRFGKFDFILVDGRARTDCLVESYELVKDSGVVVLHDANRKHYHQHFQLYRYQVLFKDYRQDEGGLWIGSKGVEIGRILDVDKHKNIWKNVSRFGKVLGI